MMKQIQLVLIGVGGYGGEYVNKILKNDLPEVRIAAVVDPMATEARHWSELSSAGIPAFGSVAEVLDSGIHADLGVVSSPIALHAEQSCALLRAGINVLCEKPMAATLEDALNMQAARDDSGNFLEIGYQWSFSAAIQSLKADILAGHFGAPRRFATWISWPRTRVYYDRNAWAGSQYDERGRPVFDSPANNATAHYLHNMLFLLGPSMAESGEPAAVTAECYRANRIRNFDAVCCRIETGDVPEVLFFSAHCVDQHHQPVFRFEFENAKVEMTDQNGIVARFNDGRETSYGDPDRNPMAKLERCLAHCRSEAPVSVVCGPEAAFAQVQCIAALQQVPICEFAPSQVRQTTRGNDETLTYVPGLAEAMRSGFEQGLLFSEQNLPWAVPAQRVPVPSVGGD